MGAAYFCLHLVKCICKHDSVNHPKKWTLILHRQKPSRKGYMGWMRRFDVILHVYKYAKVIHRILSSFSWVWRTWPDRLINNNTRDLLLLVKNCGVIYFLFYFFFCCGEHYGIWEVSNNTTLVGISSSSLILFSFEVWELKAVMLLLLLLCKTRLLSLKIKSSVFFCKVLSWLWGISSSRSMYPIQSPKSSNSSAQLASRVSTDFTYIKILYGDLTYERD